LQDKTEILRLCAEKKKTKAVSASSVFAFVFPFFKMRFFFRSPRFCFILQIIVVISLYFQENKTNIGNCIGFDFSIWIAFVFLLFPFLFFFFW